MSVRLIGNSLYSEVDVYTSGSLYVTSYDITGTGQGGGNTYDVASVAYTPPATPSDVYTITNGSFSKVISVTRVRLSSIQTTAGINSWYLVRRAAPNTAGTFTFETPVSRNSSINPTSTAIVQRYSANPTVLGLSLGNVRTAKISSLAIAPTLTSSLDQMIWDFDDFQSNPIVLRGYGQTLSLNFNGAALPPGLSIHISMTWTEE